MAVACQCFDQIDQLEQELSAQLFEKVGRRMALTKAGELLIPYVDEVLGAVGKLRFFEQELSMCNGDLKVGVGETLLCYRMPPVLKEFHKAAPKARLYLHSMNCYDIRDELISKMWAVSAPSSWLIPSAIIPSLWWLLRRLQKLFPISSRRTGPFRYRS